MSRSTTPLTLLVQFAAPAQLRMVRPAAMRRALSRYLACFALLAAASIASAQPLTRIPASSLRLSATPPAVSYSTARAFPTLSFTQPVAIVTPPGETRRLFVVEKPGRIWVIPDVTAATPSRVLFLDLTSRV